MAIVGVGLYISSICNTQQQAILSVMTFMIPAVLLSGFISPVEDMPIGWQYLTYLNPVRFFMVLSRGIFLKGMGLEDVITNLIPLIIIAALTLDFAGLNIQTQTRVDTCLRLRITIITYLRIFDTINSLIKVMDVSGKCKFKNICSNFFGNGV